MCIRNVVLSQAEDKVPEPEPAPAPMNVDMSDVAPMEMGSESSEQHSAGFDATPLGSRLDAAVADLYRKYPTVSQALLDDVLRLTRLPQPPTVLSAKELLHRVDLLPGTTS